jgi:hypothetical protein
MSAADDVMKEIDAELFGGETPSARAKKIFEHGAPFAAAAIVNLVHNGANDSIKLRAAQEVVNRVLGPLGKDDQQDALNQFLAGIEEIANEPHRTK